MPKYSDGFQKASLVSSLLTAVAPCQVCAVQKPAFPQHISSSVADPFGDLDVQHEEVHMFLSFIQRQRLANDCNQHGSAGYTLVTMTPVKRQTALPQLVVGATSP